MNVARICSLVAALASSAALAQAPGKDIKIGGIFDLTGITSDVGKSFAKGVHDGVVWTNENGGINGKRVNLVEVDYGYKIPEAGGAHQRLVNGAKGILINGWGTRRTGGAKAPAKADQTPHHP